MKKIALSIMALSLILLVGCKDDKKKMEEDDVTSTEVVEETKKETPKGMTITMESKSESNATGSVAFKEVNGTVAMEATLEGLTPGVHAIHIHEKADCSAADGTSTGGHWNPTFAQHGKWGATEGYHRGDIGNFKVGEDGKGFISMQTNEWCIGCDDETKNIVGKAIIVHQGEDDFVTQPTGDAGGRVSCGGIIQ
ncbi:Cu-Zn family superoxide dismutase [Ulvibacter sp. MAR_2010_11]|uniref:superoxide dismutase family protein n=1 Tax=Ulvibacter sp. MAR_2010_11 TaxID=1250229 RepID=UPI000C2BB023|nr:superoxide dismutase family protein [Ulvibacter sp. MAR_2010_11]PKA83875.1 Cu-Zn family superoxide dismutase [Ulvibacter sp. MAR_2010_11]